MDDCATLVSVASSTRGRKTQADPVSALGFSLLRDVDILPKQARLPARSPNIDSTLHRN
jgi:hypothetical protein